MKRWQIAILLADASAIAWRGVTNTHAYIHSNDFEIGNDEYVSKDEIQQVGVQYLISQKGKPKCD